ncbi:MAG: hypothetical protein GXO97_08465 [Nitrospirae bacterium]|nr:hypothetical protein [Nitrospirota bacterium]
MILNVYSIVYLFGTILIGGLSLVLTVVSLRAYLSQGKKGALQEHLNERGYLLLHIAHVILVAEAFTLPLFYLTLQSFVPYIQGAMCIFGVTQAQGTLSGIVQIVKVSLFFLVGWWLLLDRLDNKTERSPLNRKKTLFLFFISIFMVLDSILQIYYILGFDVEVDVACCTTVFDLAERKTSIISSSLLGENYQSLLLFLYYLTNLVLLILLWLSYRRAHKQEGLPLLLTAASVFAMLNAFVTVLAYFEVISPRVMNIPGHHCIYCMWQYSPLSALFTFLFVVGTFMPGWALLLYLTGRHEETRLPLASFIKRLTLSGIVFIGTALVLQTVLM